MKQINEWQTHSPSNIWPCDRSALLHESQLLTSIRWNIQWLNIIYCMFDECALYPWSHEVSHVAHETWSNIYLSELWVIDWVTHTQIKPHNSKTLGRVKRYVWFDRTLMNHITYGHSLAEKLQIKKHHRERNFQETLWLLCAYLKKSLLIPSQQLGSHSKHPSNLLAT